MSKSNIVQRLITLGAVCHVKGKITDRRTCEDAIDEIDQLRFELQELRSELAGDHLKGWFYGTNVDGRELFDINIRQDCRPTYRKTSDVTIIIKET